MQLRVGLLQLCILMCLDARFAFIYLHCVFSEIFMRQLHDKGFEDHFSAHVLCDIQRFLGF